ncbi:hypothetical protein SAMN04489712_105238 [Thermomonospora echinospora]|uniref:Uncharacterized protein n=1 Tax=Thermomonospora echinospora TaxID=1992 RepID=A0A1H6A8W3_9ACTN|nr:hypothetical protein [Thermomonospora echinospora]SEG44186.1 hypothetical protein SAMN04489712_105238 [Thermomonospora echinospora]
MTTDATITGSHHHESTSPYPLARLYVVRRACYAASLVVAGGGMIAVAAVAGTSHWPVYNTALAVIILGGMAGALAVAAYIAQLVMEHISITSSRALMEVDGSDRHLEQRLERRLERVERHEESIAAALAERYEDDLSRRRTGN